MDCTCWRGIHAKRLLEILVLFQLVVQADTLKANALLELAGRDLRAVHHGYSLLL